MYLYISEKNSYLENEKKENDLYIYCINKTCICKYLLYNRFLRDYIETILFLQEI